MSKTAIITGAAKNIGKGITKSLLEDGFKCILLDIDKDALRTTVDELDASSDQCVEYVIDIADTQAVSDFVGWLKQEAIQVDILVNNVAYESKASVLSITTDELTKSSATNLESPFYLTSLIANMMTDANTAGNIVFISSTHGTVIRTHPLYSSSKAAIEMFVKEAALELAANNIRVNAVAPGPVFDTTEPQQNQYVPMGVAQQPQDIAECLMFLISEKARFITGQTITVDGGFSIAHTHYWKNQDRL